MGERIVTKNWKTKNPDEINQTIRAAGMFYGLHEYVLMENLKDLQRVFIGKCQAVFGFCTQSLFSIELMQTQRFNYIQAYIKNA